MFIPIIKDAASASAALQKGDINWQTEITSDALAALKADPNLQIAEHPDFGYYFIAFNLRPDHIYSDLKLRQAFSMCIDHDATVQAATDGNGAPVYANVPPASWAFDPNTPKYTLDVAGAKALIEGDGLDPRQRRHLRQGRQEAVEPTSTSGRAGRSASSSASWPRTSSSSAVSTSTSRSLTSRRCCSRS